MPGYCGRPHFFDDIQSANFLSVDGCAASIINASDFRGRDPLKLSLAAQVGFKLSKNPQHIQKGLTGRRPGVYGLLRHAEGNSPKIQGMDNILQISDAAGQPIYPGDDQGIARA